LPRRYEMKISIIIGTRPEIIKMAPIIKELMIRKEDFSVIHTGQHYSYEMDKIFFEELELPRPDYNLDIGSGTHGTQTGKMLERIEDTLLKNMTDVILVQGDTNTVIAGALVAAKLSVKIGHVEAGLRSYDRSMPEEINRIVADHISDYLFVPTNNAKINLMKEGISANKIFVTGNTIVDSVYQNLDISKKRKNILKDMGLNKKKYILVTIHRQENVDNKDRFKGILRGLAKISQEYNCKIVYPMHPRSKKMIEGFALQNELENINNLKICDPVGYLEFLQLESNARLIATDSGGIQEEACILKVPCITLRNNTERLETIDVGANLLAGTDPRNIFSMMKIMISRKTDWTNPFGDGSSSKKIVDIITE
jgi:UDP-N-acetylglucosamine 2-epimerase (non-hydrolysing)